MQRYSIDEYCHPEYSDEHINIQCVLSWKTSERAVHVTRADADWIISTQKSVVLEELKRATYGKRVFSCYNRGSGEFIDSRLEIELPGCS